MTERGTFFGWIEVLDGKINSLGEGYPSAVSGGDIDAGGYGIYPGFIDVHTHLGLFGSGVGKEGEDVNESSENITPTLNVLDAIDPFDYSFELARRAGVTSVLVSPGSANPVAGLISAIKTSGKCVDDMLIRTVGMKLALGENPKLSGKGADTRMGTAAAIRQALSENTSLKPVLDRKLKAHFHCHKANDIFTALRISKELGLDPVLIHCTDGYLIAEELKKQNVPCVVGPIINDRCKPELANLDPKNAGVLSKAGLPVAICTDHSETPIEYLPLSAAIAVKHGMDRQKALEAITCTAAEIAGISDRVGSLKEGLDADLCIFDGDPLELMSRAVIVMINGIIV